jgi:hypothetical protein
MKVAKPKRQFSIINSQSGYHNCFRIENSLSSMSTFKLTLIFSEKFYLSLPELMNKIEKVKLNYKSFSFYHLYSFLLDGKDREKVSS